MIAERAYLAELARRVSTLTAGELVGVYVGGSIALGDYEAGRSDLPPVDPARARAFVELTLDRLAD